MDPISHNRILYSRKGIPVNLVCCSLRFDLCEISSKHASQRLSIIEFTPDIYVVKIIYQLENLFALAKYSKHQNIWL